MKFVTLPQLAELPSPEPEPEFEHETEPDWSANNENPEGVPIEWEQDPEVESQAVEDAEVPEFNSLEETDAGETMLKFIRDTLMPVAESGRTIDALNRFGLNVIGFLHI